MSLFIVDSTLLDFEIAWATDIPLFLPVLQHCLVRAKFVVFL